MKKVLLIFTLVMIAFTIIVLSTGCDSFKEVQPQVLTDYPECVVMLNTGEIYKGADKDKSGTVLPVAECLSSIKRQRCAMEVFNKLTYCNGKKIYVIDWGADKDKMSQFNDCMSRK